MLASTPNLDLWQGFQRLWDYFPLLLQSFSLPALLILIFCLTALALLCFYAAYRWKQENP